MKFEALNFLSKYLRNLIIITPHFIDWPVKRLRELYVKLIELDI